MLENISKNAGMINVTIIHLRFSVILCHPSVGGDPYSLNNLDSHFRGNDDKIKADFTLLLVMKQLTIMRVQPHYLDGYGLIFLGALYSY